MKKLRKNHNARHFVDVYRVGVLISGKSGIGKSEVTLELVKGHSLWLMTDEVTRLEGELEARGMSVVQPIWK